MGITETLIVYTLIGLVTAAAMALSNPNPSLLAKLTATTALHAGNRIHAADSLGLSRQGLLNKIARYNLEA